MTGDLGPSIRVVRAAAGCGKTTALARAYLKLVADGVPVDRIVAITFTRRAAAELVERVGLALRAAAGDPGALAELGAAADLYLDAAPSDRTRALEALADLGSAPIGTTDHFVNQLLAEFALDAELVVPSLEPQNTIAIPLDIGLVAVPDLSTHLDAAARRLLDPPDGEPPDEVRTLTRYFTLGEILEMTTRSAEIDGYPPGRGTEVLRWISREVAACLEPFDLEEALGLEGLVGEARMDRLQSITNKGAEWTLPAILEWLDDSAPVENAPRQLVSWFRKTHKGRTRALWSAVRGHGIDFGITEVRMDHILAALRHPYEDPHHLELADTLRAAVDRLRVQVAADALETAAAQGELSHTELTRAAAHLCNKPVLDGRFSALLVDEIQDASPDQLALYEALAARPGVESVFVGDGRQSIYLFRGGEPEGLERLTGAAGERVEPLLTNHRSTEPLVSAQRVLFGALSEPMQAERWTPLEPLDALLHDPERDQDVLSPDHHRWPEPVVAVYDPKGRKGVRDIDGDALHAFWDRVQDAWSEPGHESDTAAVLCPTWRKAHDASVLLRKLAGDEGVAWVDGGDGWLGDGVGRDLSLWLRALLDRTDDVAWLGVWKHPSVGLTDGALARIRKGIGIQGSDDATPWMRQLGLVVAADALQRPHRDDDIEAFARVRPVLAEALGTIGRDDTSLVLDRMVTALDWRTLLAASPGGMDEVARLEVLLDWIGELDAQGASVDVISSMLGADQRADVPRVRLERPRRAITCTTVFQAKGLAWDHVCVLSPGRAGRLEPDPDADVWMEIDGRRLRMLGLQFDPEGGLVPYQDPIRRLASVIQKTRFSEEGARLAYVAVTRARRSVTFGIPNNFWGTSDIQKLVANTWSAIDHPTVRYIHPPKRPELAALERYTVRADADQLPAHVPQADPLLEQAPSAAASRYSRDQRQALAERIRSMVTLGGFTPGTEDQPPPRDHHPDLTPADWGTLAHGWFAAWRFEGPVNTERIDDWLASEWGGRDAHIARWLGGVSTRLRDRGGPMWNLVTDDKSRLWFEYPLVGRGGPQDDLLLSGRIDLLVARPGGVVVVDFKAGDKSPTDLDDLIDGASLKTYGPQLDSYRDALGTMGLSVEAVALWYVRTGASVMW